MATPDEIRATIDRYIEAFTAGDAEGWAALFSEDATQEDPVGTPVNTGRAAIQGFLDNNLALFGSLQLHLKQEPVIIGHEAALSLYALAGTGADRARMPDIIDHMTFGDDASITSLRAFWTMDSITPDPE